VQTLEEADKFLICIDFHPCNEDNMPLYHTRIPAVLIEALS
jgi:hypothetical protein